MLAFGAGRRRKSSFLAESIADGILLVGLVSGDRLPVEAAMVAHYGVGRGSLREALRILEAQGVIEIRVGKGGGAFVAQPQPRALARPLSILFRLSSVGLREVFEARLIVEPALASLAATQRSETQLAALAENTRLLDEVRVGSDQWRRLNREFHTLVSEASGNRPLSMLWRALSTIADGHDAGVRYSPHALGGAVCAHRRVLAALTAGDGPAAHHAMTVHLQATVDHVRTFYPHLLDAPINVVPDGT